MSFISVDAPRRRRRTVWMPMIGPKLSSRMTRHRVVDVGQHGRLEPVAAAASTRWPPRSSASRPWPRASATCASSTSSCGGARERADVGGLVGRIADREARHGRRRTPRRRRRGSLVHVDALDRAAALAGVVERAVGQRLGRRLGDVDVVAHVDRVLAAELELQRDHARRPSLRRSSRRWRRSR